MAGPDLPAPHELFGIEAWEHRWPSGTHETELVAGVLVFHPASDTPQPSIFENYHERVAQLRGDDSTS